MVKMGCSKDLTSVSVAGMEFKIEDGVAVVPEGAVKALEELGFKNISSYVDETTEVEAAGEPVDAGTPQKPGKK